MDNYKDLLLIESVVKLAALNKLLVKKGLITEAELHHEMTDISKDLVEQIKNVSPEILSSLTKDS
jgi:hypothetical protein